ncbi:NmrA family NAD(P)-binding protein [Phaeocystidibacter luteus]|uniref:NAD(P)H-binding protein n=1 Tax=Phaeocystidibacter luteus TaxID=911197 RepID=A0A6N6RMF4_9FLAO|nr:NmrA family NAD(P)-binding protein [Phaeocystidibacter luteus]KAB2814764.1 NAD(P)H-binding protein [Phaeocystidibacter luteus]
MKQKRALITGATGNVGQAVIEFLNEIHDTELLSIHAGVRSKEKAAGKFPDSVSLITFDFEDQTTHEAAFEDVDVLFLLRPPQISDVKGVFAPMLNTAVKCGINKVVFLSVQGVESSSVIPHHKIEAIIRKLQFEYVFLRPSYFMQNLTTTLLPEIRNKRTITLPSANAVFNWIDVKNIGEVGAYAVNDFESFRNRAIELTGEENLNFKEVANLLSKTLDLQITYRPVSPFTFFFQKAKNSSLGYAFVVTMLHFLPRVQNAPIINHNFLEICGSPPTRLEDFITRERKQFTP